MNCGEQSRFRGVARQSQHIVGKLRRIIMIRTILNTSIAVAAIALAGPALAGPGHGGGGGGGGGGGAPGAGAHDNMGASGLAGTSRMNNSTTGSFTNPAVGTSQGLNHASTTGIANANAHSVLAGGAVASSALPGLNTGLNVVNSSGTSIGTVSQIVTDSSGNIRLVIVTSATGQTFR